MIATMNSKVDIVKLLVNNGADIKELDVTGKSALDLAKQYQCRTVEEYLTLQLSTLEMSE